MNVVHFTKTGLEQQYVNHKTDGSMLPNMLNVTPMSDNKTPPMGIQRVRDAFMYPIDILVFVKY